MTVKRLKPGVSVQSNGGLADLSQEDFFVEFEGATLATWERNGPDDSDFLALVWTGQELKALEYASTSYWSYANSAIVDATCEVKQLAAGWLRQRDIAGWMEQMLRDGGLVQPGRRVRVVKGRTVAIGTEGLLLRRVPSHYRNAPERCQIRDDAGGKHWTALTNLEFVNADPEWTPEGEIEHRVNAHVAWLVATGTEWQWIAAYEVRGGYLTLEGPVADPPWS